MSQSGAPGGQSDGVGASRAPAGGSPVAGGGVTCDAIDLGDTQLNSDAARGGLPEQSNSSWAEFDPYDGFSDKLGNN